MSSPSLRLLIIDDLPDNRKLLRLDLEDEIPNITVDEAALGKDGLELLTQHDYTMVICDILMPEMDGYDVLREARKIARARHTPFLFLSALRQTDSIKKGLQLGAVDYLVKPYDVDELMYKVQNLAAMKLLQDDLQRSQAELLQVNHRLEKLNEEKNRVLQIVSHDLRSPLAGIKGLAKILYSEPDASDEATVRDFAKSIYDTVENLNKLVNDLLNITRIESTTEVGLNLYHIDLSSVISKIIGNFQQLAAHKSIALNVLGPERLDMVADEPKLIQVINNLLSNAIKFTPNGGLIVIEFNVDSGADTVNIRVADDGIGIPDKFKNDLFKKFGKHQRFGTDGETGVGLGLPIVKAFVELHGGSVRIQSEENVGTAVTVILPREVHIDVAENSSEADAGDEPAA